MHVAVDVLFDTDVHRVVQLHAFPDFVYPDLQLLSVHEPLPQLPVEVRDQLEQPEHDAPADEQPELV